MCLPPLYLLKYYLSICYEGAAKGAMGIQIPHSTENRCVYSCWKSDGIPWNPPPFGQCAQPKSIHKVNQKTIPKITTHIHKWVVESIPNWSLFMAGCQQKTRSMPIPQTTRRDARGIASTSTKSRWIVTSCSAGKMLGRCKSWMHQGDDHGYHPNNNNMYV